MPELPAVIIRDLSFTHDGASAPLFTGLSAHLPLGFTGVIGANGAGKSTLLRILCSELAPSAGRVEGAAEAVLCTQRTDAPPGDLDAFLEDWGALASRLRGQLGIEPDYGARWPSLSHGERKRTQIAFALWRRPGVLAVDEPTNHLDQAARALLAGALAGYRGVGVIVSHDRALLDALCAQCVWLEPPGAQVYAGGYTQSREQRRLDRERRVAERDQAMRAHRALEAEMAVRRDRAAHEHKARSKRGLDRNDSDGRERIDRARVADGKSGASLRQMQGRERQAAERLDALRVDKEHRTGIWLSAERSRRDRLFTLPSGEITLGGQRVLRHPALSMRPSDRIAIIGPNGSGKSTLVRELVRSARLPPDQLVEMPQEIPLEAAAELLETARDLAGDRLGQVMTVVSRLGSRPGRLLETAEPSPGEIRKLLLALGMTRTPQLLILDEPTNHLDLPSIEALEAALLDCPCGLVLVSHDFALLERLTSVSWRVVPDRHGDSDLVVP